MLKKINAEYREGDSIVIRFYPGTYHFHEKGAAIKEYYISNHDQDNPKKVGISLEGMKHLTLDGGGASFVFHGRMLPISLLHSENCVLKNFSIDYLHSLWRDFFISWEFHFNRNRFWLEKVNRVSISE